MRSISLEAPSAPCKFSWMMFRHAGAVARYNETTMILSLPLWIFAIVMGVLFIVCAAAFLLSMRDRDDAVADETGETPR